MVGASSEGAGADAGCEVSEIGGVGVAGVVEGCAMAPLVPVSIVSATVLAMRNDRFVDRARRRGGGGL